MSTERSDQLHHAATQAEATFDYFMAGLCTALLGYLAPSLRLGRIGANPPSLELLSALLLLLAVVAALKRIDSAVVVLKLNAKMLYHQERAGGLIEAASSGAVLMNKSTGDVITSAHAAEEASLHKDFAQKIRESLELEADRTSIWYSLRNGLFLASLLSLLAARIWSGYTA